MTDGSGAAGENEQLPGARRRPGQGPVLCLSGGGFRATLFHLGAVRRLNELGVLARLAVITSVSGGSILNGILATRWSTLTLGPEGVLNDFESEVAQRVRRFCGRDLRTRLLVGYRTDPANWPDLLRNYLAVPANMLAREYGPLFGQMKLCDVPEPAVGTPRFVFCATSVQTGACWHFHAGPAGRMGDYYTGYAGVGGTPVAEAVAASSAFPPGFGALRLQLPGPAVLSRVDPWGRTRPPSAKRPGIPGDIRDTVLLTDGGVYDNLGVEPVWDGFDDLLVSDAGKPFAAVATVKQLFTSRLRRAFDVSSEQVGAVRKRWLVEEYRGGRRRGVLWQINTRVADYPLADARAYPDDVRALFPAVRTDLNAFGAAEMACLENHGYSLTDAAMRSYGRDFCQNSRAPFRWPNPDHCTADRVREGLARSHTRGILRDLWRYVWRA